MQTELAGSLLMLDRGGDESMPSCYLCGQSHHLLEIEFGDDSRTVDRNCSVKELNPTTHTSVVGTKS